MMSIFGNKIIVVFLLFQHFFRLFRRINQNKQKKIDKSVWL